MSYGSGAFGAVAYGAAGGADESVVSPVAALLADPLAERETLIWAQPWDPDAAARTSVYLSGGGYASGVGDTWPDGTACAHQLFRARLRQTLRYEARVANAGVLTGESPSTYGDAEIIVADGELGELDAYDWRTAPVQAYQGLPHWHLRDFARVFSGTAADLRRGLEIQAISLRDIAEKLRVPAQRRLYRGLGAAWRGDGVDDYGAGTVPCPAGSMGVEAWIRPTTSSSATRRICGWYPSTGNAGIRSLYLSPTGTNRIAFRVGNDAGGLFEVTFDSAPSLTNTHIYAELDTAAAKLRLYVNGELVHEIAVSGAWTTTRTTFEILRKPELGGEFFPGDIDEVRIWDSAAIPRSLTSIAELMGREVVGTETGLQDVFHLNEATGTTAYTGTATSRTLTLAGGGKWTSILEGGADLAGKRRIKVGGAVHYVKPVAIDSLGLVFELNAGPVNQVTAHLDAGLSGTFAYAGTVSDVYAWTPVAGQFVDCYCQTVAGEYVTLFRYGSAPVGTLLMSLQGDNTGGYVADAPRLARRECLQVLSTDELDAGSIIRATAQKPYAVGFVLYPDDQRTIYGLVVELLGWVSAWLIASREGFLTMGVRGAAGSSVATLTADDVNLDGIEDLGALPAARRHRVYYAHYSQPQSGGDLQSGVTRAVREDLGQEYRVALSSETAGVVAADEAAEDVEITTGIFARSDALAHAAAEQEFRATEHRAWRIPLVGLPHQFSVGMWVTLDLPEAGPLEAPLSNVLAQIQGLLVDESADVYAVEVLA